MLQSWKAADLLWKSLDGEFIVFNRTSGNTHLLNPVAAQALKALEQGPANAAQLSQRIASQVDLKSDGELAQHVEALLANLDQLGLIEPVS